jgi:F-type H+-transporting ATPase subunit b
MLIDWFTVGAQVVNFLVLVLLLKHFLYKPILKAIDTREKRIASELADADAKRASAQKEREEFEGKNRELEAHRAQILAKAAEEAKSTRASLLDEARKEADALRASQADALKADRTRISEKVSNLARGEVFQIARKALGDLATVSLEERIGEVFTRRLREMDAKQKEALATAVRTSPGPAVVRSAFDLGDRQRGAIQNAVNECFASEVRLRFETSPDVICGIELTANGQRLSWDIEGYLAGLDEKVQALLESQSAPPSAPAPPAGAVPAPVLRPAA